MIIQQEISGTSAAIYKLIEPQSVLIVYKVANLTMSSWAWPSTEPWPYQCEPSNQSLGSFHLYFQPWTRPESDSYRTFSSNLEFDQTSNCSKYLFEFEFEISKKQTISWFAIESQISEKISRLHCLWFSFKNDFCWWRHALKPLRELACHADGRLLRWTLWVRLLVTEIVAMHSSRLC